MSQVLVSQVILHNMKNYNDPLYFSKHSKEYTLMEMLGTSLTIFMMFLSKGILKLGQMYWIF